MSSNCKLFALFVIVVMSFYATSCNSTVRVKSTNQSLMLSDDQVSNFASQANNGNADAAFRLYMYYRCIKMDYESANKWVGVAATNGNSSAQYIMGMMNDGELYPDLLDLKKARYWFEKALSNGNTNALPKLDELKRK